MRDGDTPPIYNATNQAIQSIVAEYLTPPAQPTLDDYDAMVRALIEQVAAINCFIGVALSRDPSIKGLPEKHHRAMIMRLVKELAWCCQNAVAKPAEYAIGRQAPYEEPE